MNKKDFILPLIFGVVALCSTIFFKNSLITLYGSVDLSGEIFTFSSTLFGLILTAYGIFFGIIPAMNKEFATSETVKDIKGYFLSCLVCLLLEVIISLTYLIHKSYFLFSTNLIILLINIGFFAYIIFLLDELFEVIIQ